MNSDADFEFIDTRPQISECSNLAFEHLLREGISRFYIHIYTYVFNCLYFPSSKAQKCTSGNLAEIFL